MSGMPHTSLELVRVAALAADAKKATDVVVLDLRGLTDVCDYFLVCTGSNARLMDSVVEEIRERVSQGLGVKPLSVEGRRAQSWVLMDYGEVVVHVFSPEARDYYRLERLWGDAPRVDLGLGDEDGRQSGPAPDAAPQEEPDRGEA